MSWIFDFFTSVGEIIVSLITFLVDSIISLFQLILLLPRYLTYLFDIFNLLPAFVLPFALMSLTILIIWLVKEII